MSSQQKYFLLQKDLAVRTRALAERAHEIQTTGLTGPYEKAFRDLEEKLAQAQSIVNSRNATAAAVTTLMELIEQLRYRFLYDFKYFTQCNACRYRSRV